MKKNCKHCGQEFETQKNAPTRQYCYDCNPIGEQLSGNVLRKKIKLWALEYKGGKCARCGYDKNPTALDFHHMNPEEKDFNLSSSNISSNWEFIKPELDKCILLCANCHREVHDEIVQNQIITDLTKKQVHNSKRVRCLNTKEIFGSCEIAGNYFGINHPSHIKEVCNGTRNYCGTHPETKEHLDWEWVDIDNDTAEMLKYKKQELKNQSALKAKECIDKMRKRNGVKIKCSTGETFDSIVEASKWCHISDSSIGRALKNPNFTAGTHPTTNKRLHWFKITEEQNE